MGRQGRIVRGMEGDLGAALATTPEIVHFRGGTVPAVSKPVPPQFDSWIGTVNAR